MKINQLFVILLAGVFIFSACNDSDEPDIPISVNFSNTELGLSDEVSVTVSFSRPITSAGTIDVSIDAPGLNYGADLDYFTEPAAQGDMVTIPFESGDESLSLTIKAGSSLNIQQDQTITLNLEDEAGFDLGNDVSAVVTVSENFIAPEGIIEIDGGGAEFPNQVFVDLSKLQQTPVDKYSWDLGFSTTAGQYAVILNSSAAVMARAIEATDIDQVTAADTAGFAAKMYLSNYQDTEASGWIDHQNGDLSETAISAVSATDGDNKVYIIKRDGEGRSWKKIRILQDGDNYTLQYADIDATTHSAVTITKDAAYNFTHFDFEGGVVSIAPESDRWDIMYGTYSGRANFGVLLAISYNDYVVINRSGVHAAMVEESTIAFDAFTAQDLNSVTLTDDDISAIGSSWRSLVNFSLVLNEEVYYILSDAEGNHYKLKFTRLASEEGERGYPEFKIQLL